MVIVLKNMETAAKIGFGKRELQKEDEVVNYDFAFI